jgi:hypothetical protein
MSESIHQLLESLPQSSLTTHVLGALDYLVPGEWQNITSFEAMIGSVTGESDPQVIQAVGEKALALWFDDSTGYSRAATIYQAMDSGSTVAGAAAMANMLGSRFEVFSFLQDVTPKPDTVQSIDAAAKLAAELAAFCSMNGLPGDSVGDFVNSLVSAGKEDSMRLAAWLSLDCVLPLGPDFLSKLMGRVQEISEGELMDNRLFRFVADHLPGDIAAKKNLLLGTLDGAAGHLTQMVQDKAISQEGILARVREYVEVADDKLDMVAAALDMSTNYFEHTGIQTVARRVVTRAYGEL